MSDVLLIGEIEYSFSHLTPGESGIVELEGNPLPQGARVMRIERNWAERKLKVIYTREKEIKKPTD